ncbi:ABC transporter ATP-binding protein [Streptomyces sp. NPDC046915]|uniref:ABC transporter ATP-binding protein n=1 Tax=Streptomyces sp. NPDC046915 TaxID=3155257 RepID=UPI00340BF0B4
MSSVSALVLPTVLARAVDRVLSDGTGAGFLPVAGAVGLLTAAEATAQYAGPRATAGATARLRAAMLRHTLAIGPCPPERLATGDLVARLTASTAEAALTVQAAVYAVAQLSIALGSVVALGLLAPELAAVFLIMAVVGYLLVRRQVTNTAQRGAGYLRAQADVAARLLDALAGSRTIAAAGTVEQEIERVLRPVPELGRHGRALWDSQRRVAWSTGLLAPATQIAVLGVAGYELATGAITPGDLVAALAYTTLGLGGLGGLGTVQSLLDLARARAGQARVLAALRTSPNPPGLRGLPPGPGRLEIRAVTVRRAGSAVLDRLELVVPERCCVALVGRSGAGTSLLAAVAGGLLAPDEGTVLLDGVPLDEIRPAEVRAAVSYAFGDPVLTGATVLDAIRVAARPVSEARARQAARTAHADAFIRRLPSGYHTAVPGAPLSGGERQRVGLARALSRDCRLLVLDDATSSLDTTTEAQVLCAMDVTHGARTRLVVTRRTSTAARADVVAWLHEGRVQAVAPHEELWKQPAYRGIFRDTGDDRDTGD